jgi:RND family efflux transporter MFP subunit
MWIKRIVWILIGASLLFFAGLRIYDIQEKQAAPSAKKKKGGARVVTVSVTEARTGQLRDVLLLTGALKPKEQVDVTAKVTGRLLKLLLKIGDPIREGVLIAELEGDEIQQQVNRAQASIGVARALMQQRQAEQENAKAELSRSQSLLDDGLISPQDFASTRTQLEVIEAQVELARAQTAQTEAELRELKIRLEQTKIYAPMSGIVATRFVDQGAIISPTTPILRIVNLSTMVTLANVPERNIGRLSVGNPAEIEVDAMPGEILMGRVARIAPVLDAATRTALVEIDVPNTGNRLKAEMFVRIRLDTGAMREAVLIPREGLVYRGTQPGVYVIEGDRPVFRAIETGLTREDNVEVIANLDAGVKIVGRGATILEDGDLIKAAGATETAVEPPAQAGTPAKKQGANSEKDTLKTAQASE